MSGFSPHTGIVTQGYTALPAVTFDTFLESIVADVGVGVNGWTLHDDLRTVGGSMLWPWCGGFNYMRDSSNNKKWNIPAGSASVTWGSTAATSYKYGARANWDFTPNISQVSWNNVDWYTVTSVSNFYTFGISPNYAGPALGNVDADLYFKYTGSIVLKCTSSQKTFYVQITRPLSYNCVCLVQVFEDWNSVTHVGTNGGPIERVRGYSNQKNGATTIQYIMFLLPDAFALWASGDPKVLGGGITADLYYAGNMIPIRPNDDTCLIQTCSNQDFSGIGICTNGVAFNTGQIGGWGAAAMFRNLAGTTWKHPLGQEQFPGTCIYALAPRGLDYIWAVDRTNLDESARMQFVEYDAYQSYTQNNGNTVNEGKRGALRHIKSPLMSPSGLHLASLGAADDGNTYIMLRVSHPWTANQQDGYGPTDWGYHANYPAVMSGFAHTNRWGSIGELNPNNGANILLRRFFMLPINL